MSKIHRVHHGAFGHVSLLELTHELITHAHSAANVSFWLFGAVGEVTVNGAVVGHDAASATLIGALMPHGLRVAEGDGPMHSLSFYLNQDWLSQMLPPGVPASFTHLTIAISPDLRSELLELRRMLLSDTGDETEIDATLAVFLRHALSEIGGPAPGDRERERGARDFRLRKALALMRENVSRDFDLERLARQSGLSRPHFFSMFRDELEVTPGIVWNSLRLEEALDQMRRSQSNLTAVASNLGFSAQCNFTRFFRQHTGVTPSEYRFALKRGGTDTGRRQP